MAPDGNAFQFQTHQNKPTPETKRASKDNKVLLTGPALKVARLTERLTSVIAEETKLLNERRPREAQQAHGEKSRLIVEYREALGLLKQNDRCLGDKQSHERTYVRELTDKLRDAIRDNARVVLRLKSVAEGIVRSVGDEVNRRNKPVSGYSANASTPRRQNTATTSLAFNQVI